MNFPFWNVAIIGSGWVIGLIAIFHVIISHFAVGGGLLMPILERQALKRGDDEWRVLLRRNMKFFLIITGVLGTVSGVGIWFSIGLAQPQGTSALIHIFVFFWAIEWVFFLIELASAAVYYYSWGRISDKLHLAVGWCYCIASIATLFFINGILSFMLTPGAEWIRAAWMDQAPRAVISGFFNPTYWPSLFIRILAAIALASVFLLFSFSRTTPYISNRLKSIALRNVVLYFIPALLLLPIGLLWYLHMTPESQQALLKIPQTGILKVGLWAIIGAGLISATAFILVFINPIQFGRKQAWIILLLSASVVAASEYSREILRKPYIIVGYMYSNGIREADVEKFNKEGFLDNSLWVRKNDYGVGEAMFRGQCMSCHTWNGYRSMEKLLKGKTIENLQTVLNMLYDYEPESLMTHYMPPLVGTTAERRALAAWLIQKANLYLENEEKNSEQKTE